MSDKHHKPEQEINHSQNSPLKKNATAFYIKLVIAGISLYIILVLGAFVYTGIREARNTVRREEIKRNLNQIGLALEQYAARQAEQEKDSKTD